MKDINPYEWLKAEEAALNRLSFLIYDIKLCHGIKYATIIKEIGNILLEKVKKIKPRKLTQAEKHGFRLLAKSIEGHIENSKRGLSDE